MDWKGAGKHRTVEEHGVIKKENVVHEDEGI